MQSLKSLLLVPFRRQPSVQPPELVIEDGRERHPQQVGDQQRRGPAVDAVEGDDGRGHQSEEYGDDAEADHERL